MTTSAKSWYPNKVTFTCKLELLYIFFRDTIQSVTDSFIIIQFIILTSMLTSIFPSWKFKLLEKSGLSFFNYWRIIALQCFCYKRVNQLNAYVYPLLLESPSHSPCPLFTRHDVFGWWISCCVQPLSGYLSYMELSLQTSGNT